MTVDIDADLSDLFVRKLIARRLAWDIEGTYWREAGDAMEHNPNYDPLTYKEALDTTEQILELVHTRQQGERARISHHRKRWQDRTGTDLLAAIDAVADELKDIDQETARFLIG